MTRRRVREDRDDREARVRERTPAATEIAIVKRIYFF
jgi:hypothetical protein